MFAEKVRRKPERNCRYKCTEQYPGAFFEHEKVARCQMGKTDEAAENEQIGVEMKVPQKQRIRYYENAYKAKVKAEQFHRYQVHSKEERIRSIS